MNVTLFRHRVYTDVTKFKRGHTRLWRYDCEMPVEHPSGNVKEAIVLVHSQAAKYIRFKY